MNVGALFWVAKAAGEFGNIIDPARRPIRLRWPYFPETAVARLDRIPCVRGL